MATSTSNTTTDHNEIKKWVESHDGKPAQVRDAKGLLRIEFQDTEDNLEPIEWDRFFELFEENKLALIYQEDTTFCKFINRD